MTVAELVKGLAEYPPDALVMFKDSQGIMGPVSRIEARDLARVTSTGQDVLYFPGESRVVQSLIDTRGCKAVYFPAAVMML